MKAADIHKDPWSARDKVKHTFYDCVAILEDIWISEDSWEEDPEYRNEVVKMLLALDKLAVRAKSHIQLNTGKE